MHNFEIIRYLLHVQICIYVKSSNNAQIQLGTERVKAAPDKQTADAARLHANECCCWHFAVRKLYPTFNPQIPLPTIAQSIGRWTLNSRVVGSSPILVSFYQFVYLAAVCFVKMMHSAYNLIFFIIVFACICELLSSGKGLGNKNFMCVYICYPFKMLSASDNRSFLCEWL